MINKLTKTDLRNLLDKGGYASRVDSDGDFYITLEADSDFAHDVLIFFACGEDNGRLTITGMASDFDVPQSDVPNAIVACNDYNINFFFPTAQVFPNNGRIVVNRTWIVGNPVSPEYLIAEIKTTVSSIWQFFCKLDINK